MKKECLLGPGSPGSSAAPFAQAIKISLSGSVLFISGQVSNRETVESQLEEIWDRVESLLLEGGMKRDDVIKITTYLVREEDFRAFSSSRLSFFGAHKPASTVVVVKALARPELLVEVEAIAAA